MVREDACCAAFVQEPADACCVVVCSVVVSLEPEPPPPQPASAMTTRSGARRFTDADASGENQVVDRVPIRYAKSGDVNVAYQVTGEGPIDLVAGSGRRLYAATA
jgi:hypothetical protein